MVALPWFSFNPKVTGYYWGMDSLLYAWVPLIIIALYLFQWKTNRIGNIILAEVALIAVGAAQIGPDGKHRSLHEGSERSGTFENNHTPERDARCIEDLQHAGFPGERSRYPAKYAKYLPKNRACFGFCA